MTHTDDFPSTGTRLRIQNYSSKRHIRQLRIIYFGRFWLMVIVMVGVMVKVSVMVRVRVIVLGL